MDASTMSPYVPAVIASVESSGIPASRLVGGSTIPWVMGSFRSLGPRASLEFPHLIGTVETSKLID